MAKREIDETMILLKSFRNKSALFFAYADRAGYTKRRQTEHYPTVAEIFEMQYELWPWIAEGFFRYESYEFKD